jgi:hypothetical protein
MKALYTPLLYKLSLVLFSCGQTPSAAPVVDPTWVKVSLRSGWVCYAPKGFESIPMRGVDSTPGLIQSKQDGISLEYDSGGEMGLPSTQPCTLQNSAAKAKEEINSSFYTNYYKVTSTHTAQIDTINDEIAIIVKPVHRGKGMVNISISSCKTGRFISITGKNLTPKKEQLVLAIFQTVKFNQ